MSTLDTDGVLPVVLDPKAAGYDKKLAKQAKKAAKAQAKADTKAAKLASKEEKKAHKSASKAASKAVKEATSTASKVAASFVPNNFLPIDSGGGEVAASKLPLVLAAVAVVGFILWRKAKAS